MATDGGPHERNEASVNPIGRPADREGQQSLRVPVRRAEWLAVAWFTLLFVMSIGVANGAGNQNKYLLFGMRLADPDFLVGDWFTWQVQHEQLAFAWLVALLGKSGVFLAALTVGALLQSAVFAVACYSIVRSVYDRPLVPWAAGLALFVTMDTVSLGAAHWLMPFLEASTISGVAMVVALAALARKRYVGVGIALGIAGLFHAQFVVLSVPILVATSCTMILPRGANPPWARVGLVWGLFLLLASPALFTIVSFATAPGIEEIRWVGESIFSYHVAPWTWNRDPLLMLVGAMTLGLGGALLRPPRSNLPLTMAFAAIVLTVFLSLALAYWRIVEGLVEIWPWRMSPLLLLAGLTVGVAGLSFERERQDVDAERARLGFGLLLCAAVVLAALTMPPISTVLLAVCAIPVVRWTGDRCWTRSRTVGPLLVFLLITACFAPALTESIRDSHTAFRAANPHNQRLYEWIRASTPTRAVFAVPPSWETFRLIAERPIVADWKSIPRYTPDRVEWLARMQSLTGLARPGSDPAELDAAFRSMDCERAAVLRARYGLRFVVLGASRTLDCGEVVYEDERYRVHDLGPFDPPAAP